MNDQSGIGNIVAIVLHTKLHTALYHEFDIGALSQIAQLSKDHHSSLSWKEDDPLHRTLGDMFVLTTTLLKAKKKKVHVARQLNGEEF